MKPLKKHLNLHRIGATFVIAEPCEVNIASREDEKNIPISPASNPTQILNQGDKIRLSQGDSSTTGIRVKIGEEYLWVEKDELEKIQVKEYYEMSDEEIKEIAKQIAKTSSSTNEVRRRFVNELGYPFDKNGIHIYMPCKGSCNVNFYSPKGGVLMV